MPDSARARSFQAHDQLLPQPPFSSIRHASEHSGGPCVLTSTFPCRPVEAPRCRPDRCRQLRPEAPDVPWACLSTPFRTPKSAFLPVDETSDLSSSHSLARLLPL